ncbi:hypothetical protein MKX01_005207 [Papaver californicum]|nr:hypothetical protein MKX01_005207 [Papaver californicum]
MCRATTGMDLEIINNSMETSAAKCTQGIYALRLAYCSTMETRDGIVLLVFQKPSTYGVGVALIVFAIGNENPQGRLFLDNTIVSHLEIIRADRDIAVPTPPVQRTMLKILPQLPPSDHLSTMWSSSSGSFCATFIDLIFS